MGSRKRTSPGVVAHRGSGSPLCFRFEASALRLGLHDLDPHAVGSSNERDQHVFTQRVGERPRFDRELHAFPLDFFGGRAKVRELPAEIGNLTELEELDIHSLPLETLPAEIGDLANLKELNIAGVPLKTLPAEIGKLSKLTKLTIRKADHQRLRTYIKQFPNLETLYFSPDPVRPTAN